MRGDTPAKQTTIDSRRFAMQLIYGQIPSLKELAPRENHLHKRQNT